MSALQLTFDGGADAVTVTRDRLGIPARYNGTLSNDVWRELDAITPDTLNPPTYFKNAPAEGVFLFDPLAPAIEGRVREWAVRHNVKLWEGRR